MPVGCNDPKQESGTVIGVPDRHNIVIFMENWLDRHKMLITFSFIIEIWYLLISNDFESKMYELNEKKK